MSSIDLSTVPLKVSFLNQINHRTLAIVALGLEHASIICAEGSSQTWEYLQMIGGNKKICHNDPAAVNVPLFFFIAHYTSGKRCTFSRSSKSIVCNSMVLYGNSLTLGNASDWGCLDGRSK